MLDIIDQQVWSAELKRRVQHYGYRYAYKNRSVTPSMYLGDLPDWASAIAHQLAHEGLIEKNPDQVIVNEYQPGQGISKHIDCISCFGSTVISLSLGSLCVMNFTHTHRQDKASLLVSPRSLVILQGEARYDWLHSINSRKKDKYQGIEFVRTRRISLTFRTVTTVL